jgi:pyridoxine/pyridoxamine 5'-phosphate oxidase
MPKYEINQTVNYSGVVEADSEEEAMAYFIKRAPVEFYESVESEDIEELEDEEEDEDED